MYCNARHCNVLSFFGEGKTVQNSCLNKVTDELNIWIQEPLSLLDLAKKRERKKIEITDISRAVDFKGYARYF